MSSVVIRGAILLLAVSASRRPDCSGEGMAWIPLAGGVPLSAGIGAAIGAALPVERWQRVTLDGGR